jgi:hypothetical protein
MFRAKIKSDALDLNILVLDVCGTARNYYNEYEVPAALGASADSQVVSGARKVVSIDKWPAQLEDGRLTPIPVPCLQ